MYLVDVPDASSNLNFTLSVQVPDEFTWIYAYIVREVDQTFCQYPSDSITLEAGDCCGTTVSAIVNNFTSPALQAGVWRVIIESGSADEKTYVPFQFSVCHENSASCPELSFGPSGGGSSSSTSSSTRLSTSILALWTTVLAILLHL